MIRYWNAKSLEILGFIHKKKFLIIRKTMEKVDAPLTAQTSKDLFSDSNNEIINTTQAASIAGVSYHKFLREFGEIPYSIVYPGGPRIYMRSEVRAFIEGKNK